MLYNQFKQNFQTYGEPMDKQNSPFTPGNPVATELFVGRETQVLEIMRYIEQSSHGRAENIFLVGERGIGKTSVSSFIRYWAQTKQESIAVHVFLGGVSSLDEMARKIFEALLKATNSENWFGKIRSLFGDFITEVGLFGVSVSFSPPKDKLDALVRNFPQALTMLLSKIKDERKSLLIVLDDLDILSTTPDFAHWYKSFVDEVATHYNEKFPVTVMLIGLPQMMDKLAELQPSLMRVFRIIELEKLSPEEVSEFFTKAFQKSGVEVEDAGLKTLVRYSSGLPLIMQELGDATFWADSDNKIDRGDALAGLITAAERIGRKYLDPQVYRDLRSPSYRSILRKIGSGENALITTFTRRDITEHLTESEKKVFDNFLRRLTEKSIIQPDTESGRGAYRFINDIYPVYIWMEAERYLKHKNG